MLRAGVGRLHYAFLQKRYALRIAIMAGIGAE